MRVSRLYCTTCHEDTYHEGMTCIRCKTLSSVLVPRLSDDRGFSTHARRLRGGAKAKLTPRRS